MARIRTTKPEFWTDEKTGKLSTFTKLMFIGIWNICDDGGVCRSHPSYIKSQLFPYADEAVGEDSPTTPRVVAALSELEKAGLVTIGEVNGESFLAVKNWLLHQKIEKPSKKKCLQIDAQTLGEYSVSAHRLLGDVNRNRSRNRKEENTNTPPTPTNPPPQRPPVRDPMGDRLKLGGVGLSDEMLKASIHDVYPNREGWTVALRFIRQVLAKEPARLADMELAAKNYRDAMKAQRREPSKMKSIANFFGEGLWESYVNPAPSDDFSNEILPAGDLSDVAHLFDPPEEGR